MLKNPNYKVIRRMAWRNLKANGRKTITLFLAVLLSSFLIFTIFTVGNSYFKLQKLQNIRMSGADFDAIMYGVTEEQRQICENAPEIILTGTIGICGWVEKTEKDSTPNVGLVWADDGYWTQMMESVREKLEGKYPKAFNEIMVTKEALKECGYEDLTVGDTLTMSYGTYSGTATGSFRISGIWDGYGPKKQFYVSKEFYDQSGWQLSQSASGRYFIDFKQKLMTQKEQKAFIERMNLGKQQSLFFTEDPGTSLQILAGLLGLSAVTCLCAYLLIYNIMHLSVAGKVRYYGLLQTIGMTETQIKRMMKEQMLLLGLAGTGTGCLLGVLVCRFCYDLLSSGYFDRNGSACRNYDFPCSQKTCKNGCKYLSDGGTWLSGSRKRRKGRKKRKNNTETFVGTVYKRQKADYCSNPVACHQFIGISLHYDNAGQSGSKNNRVE